jgi:hypothetical protein
VGNEYIVVFTLHNLNVAPIRKVTNFRDTTELDKHIKVQKARQICKGRVCLHTLCLNSIVCGPMALSTSTWRLLAAKGL